MWYSMGVNREGMYMSDHDFHSYSLKLLYAYATFYSYCRDKIGNMFALHAEYNGIAEVNSIIVLYPQIKSDFQRNPLGCWDWY